MTDYAQRLNDVQAWLAQHNLAGYFVPRADEVQGEYVMPCDERLRWLCGFDGSAGIALVLQNAAALVVDGRYTTAAAEQLRGLPIDICHYIDKPWAEWLKGKVDGGAIGFDARLHTPAWQKNAEARLQKLGLALRAAENPIDALWQNRPAPTATPVEVFPNNLAGKSSASKRSELAVKLVEQKADAALITDPTSVAWLLNIRARDLEATPVAISRVLLHTDGKAEWFIDAARVGDDVRTHVGKDVTLHAPVALADALGALKNKTLLADDHTCNISLRDMAEAAGVKITFGSCITELLKACKNAVEVAGMAAAHKRDGVALARFMYWLDTYVKPNHAKYRESDLVMQLDHYRAQANEYRGYSFATICGTGAHGAIIHYRGTPETDCAIENNTLLLIDSGGQYVDGTTDVTRTFAVGTPTEEMRRAYTAVLRGHVNLARAQFPAGTSGSPLDGIARAPLWEAGLNFDHGTGHGVGHYLSVHEGPQSISARSIVPLQVGMVVSNEPGYYKPGMFGIRIENLITVVDAGEQNGMKFNAFQTLTLVPYERALIDVGMLTTAERDWVDSYHQRVLNEVGPLVEVEVRQWLEQACKPL